VGAINTKDDSQLDDLYYSAIQLDVLNNEVFCAETDEKYADGSCKVKPWAKTDESWTFDVGGTSRIDNNVRGINAVTTSVKNTVKWKHDQDQLEIIAEMEGGEEKLKDLGYTYVAPWDGIGRGSWKINK
jgi:hypothetical protein